MGLSISGSLSALRATEVVRPQRPEAAPAASAPSAPPAANTLRTPAQQEALEPRPPSLPDVQAGFGRNTISPPAVALQTIDTNLQNARDVVPTLEEQQGRIQERLAQIQADAEARSQVRQEQQAAIAAEQADNTNAQRETQAALNVPARGVGGGAPEAFRPAPAPQAVNFVQQGVPEQPLAPTGAEASARGGVTISRLDLLA